MRYRVERASGQVPPCDRAYEGLLLVPLSEPDLYVGTTTAWFVDLEEIPDTIDGFPVTLTDSADHAAEALLTIDDEPIERGRHGTQRRPSGPEGPEGPT
jgi:hypothetical protein